MDESSNTPSPNGLDPSAEQFLARLIQKKVGQMVGGTTFTPGDAKDLEQDLRLKVAQFLSAYDGDRGHLLAFLTTLVERRTASLVRDRSAEKRDPRRVVSLSINVEVNGEGPVELAATIGDREADARLGKRTRDHETLVNLKSDVEVVLGRLTPDEREVCEALKYDSITAVSRDLGVPRATIYDMITRWREEFQDATLLEYL